jgi:hypothetical protein
MASFQHTIKSVQTQLTAVESRCGTIRASLQDPPSRAPTGNAHPFSGEALHAYAATLSVLSTVYEANPRHSLLRKEVQMILIAASHGGVFVVVYQCD